MLVAAMGVCLLSAVLQPLAYGQSSTYARLVGTVRDQTGGVVPGVDITATARATNVSRSAVSDDRGEYLIDKLKPGRYDAKAELSGFKTQVSSDFRLEVSQVARKDFVMTPGEISEQVTVLGQSPIIDNDNAEVGAVVEEQKILDLPLRGRDLVKLAYLTAGATQEGPQEIDPTRPGGYPSFNGVYSHSNQITLDGSNNQGYTTQRPAVQATPETVQEFKVITHNYSAEYGRVAGAVISMLSKSGTNEYHGHAWYYFRDTRFDAANFFTNKLGGEKLPVNYKIFGGSIGGPIVKDRTFFHAHYERFIDDFERPDFVTVPSLAMRNGDFSGEGASGPIPQLYDPFSVVDGQRTPFAGNQISRSRWSPVYQKLMELMPPPEPNVPGVSAKNYSFPNTRNRRVNKYSIRGDHHFSGGDTLFGRFSWQNTPQTRHRTSTGVPGAELHGIMRVFEDPGRGWQSAVGWVNSMGSNLVTELNVSTWKEGWVLARRLDEGNWAEELGYDDADLFPVFYPDGNRGPGGHPGIFLSGYSGWNQGGHGSLSDWGMGFKYSTSWRRGSHYLKFGFEHTRNLDVDYRTISRTGVDFFQGFLTGQIRRDAEGRATGSSFGDGWAELVMGLPTVSRGNSLGLAAADAHFNQSHYNWFVNDDWKLGPNLTLNLGLRWEQPRPAYYEGSADGSFSTDYHYCADDYSQAQGRIDPVQLMPRGLDIAQWQGPEGLALEFQNLDRRGCHEAKWRYFAPRFGLAWRLFGTNRTVLRFGTGLTYDQDFGPAGNRRMLQVRGMLEGFQPPQTEVPTLILGKRLELPSQQLSEYRTCYFSELDREEGQVYSYNLSIQHELFPATKLEVGYAGNQGRHLRNFRAFNVALPEGYVVPLIGGGTATMTSDPITAPPRPWIEGATQERTWSGQQARRPYPQVQPDPLNHTDGNSTYNSLQVKLERRFQDGVAVSTGYTWSKAMALNYSGLWGQWVDSRAYERHALRAPMPHDRSQTFYNSTIWELPFFRHSKGMTRTLLGGWQATTLITLTTGSLYQVWYDRDLWNRGRRSSVLPDRIDDGYLGESERSVDRWFDTSVFVAPVYDSSLCQGADICHEAARRALGNSSVVPLRGDGVPLVDLSLHKQFAFREEKTLDFRVDFFNAFNHAIFYAPNGNIASGAAGRVNQAATARQLQFGFRFSF